MLFSNKRSTLQMFTAQKMKFSIKDFFSKCDQIRRKLRIWSHLLKKSLMENFFFCAVVLEVNLVPLMYWIAAISVSKQSALDRMDCLKYSHRVITVSWKKWMVANDVMKQQTHLRINACLQLRRYHSW